MKKLIIIFSACCVTFFAASCGSETLEPEPEQPDPTEQEEPNWADILDLFDIHHLAAPGIGPDTAKPYNRPVDTWPGVKLVRRPNKPFNPDINLLHGNTNTFYVDVNLVNTNTTAKEHKFPAGTMFVSFARTTDRRRYQNGMLMQEVTVTVPPTGPQKDTMTIYLGLSSINLNAPSPLGVKPGHPEYPIALDMYEIHDWTTYNPLLDFAEYLTHFPKLKLTKHYDPAELMKSVNDRPEWLRPYGWIQEAMYQITDGDGLSVSEQTELTKKLKPYMAD